MTLEHKIRYLKKLDANDFQYMDRKSLDIFQNAAFCVPQT